MELANNAQNLVYLVKCEEAEFQASSNKNAILVSSVTILMMRNVSLAPLDVLSASMIQITVLLASSAFTCQWEMKVFVHPVIRHWKGV